MGSAGPSLSTGPRPTEAAEACARTAAASSSGTTSDLTAASLRRSSTTRPSASWERAIGAHLADRPPATRPSRPHCSRRRSHRCTVRTQQPTSSATRSFTTRVVRDAPSTQSHRPRATRTTVATCASRSPWASATSRTAASHTDTRGASTHPSGTLAATSRRDRSIAVDGRRHLRTTGFGTKSTETAPSDKVLVVLKSLDSRVTVAEVVFINYSLVILRSAFRRTPSPDPRPTGFKQVEAGRFGCFQSRPRPVHRSGASSREPPSYAAAPAPTSSTGNSVNCSPGPSRRRTGALRAGAGATGA